MGIVNCSKPYAICDECGKLSTRFGRLRKLINHLANVKGWYLSRDNAFCPTCLAKRAAQRLAEKAKAEARAEGGERD